MVPSRGDRSRTRRSRPDPYIGLMADGPSAGVYRPVPQSRPVRHRARYAAADRTDRDVRVGKWLERLPGLRLDGERRTSKALPARLSAFWWPEATVLYAGFDRPLVGGKAASLAAHVPGDRQPHADGQWLHLLRRIDGLGAQIWWAETDAPEESFDAFLDAFGPGDRAASTEGRPAGALALPWANMRRPTGEWQVHGITGAIRAGGAARARAGRRVVDVAAGGRRRRPARRIAAPARRAARLCRRSRSGAGTAGRDAPCWPPRARLPRAATAPRAARAPSRSRFRVAPSSG